MAEPMKPQATAAGGLDTEAFAAVEPQNARQLLLAAVECFAAAGYGATTTRDIATRVKLSPAAVYVHYRSKEDLLWEICRIGHEDVLQAMRRGVQGVSSPHERLSALVFALTAWHARNHLLGRVIQLELRALSRERFLVLAPMRHAINALVRDEVFAGVESGEFSVPSVHGVGVAIVSMCSDVARWFQLDGNEAPVALAELYVELARRMVGLPA